ncbi:trypsin-like peptidase domain-containing protein [uncultured Roseobacter sp.]|uniref:trypsin-like serine peptidase n=1 Tax=uncultured Roseobacter sp. TaxID=114847 RepID=UPI00260B3E39|nr:trypsin-like peptidase domain-containing protein [uncultured Roseobacter sp.]
MPPVRPSTLISLCLCACLGGVAAQAEPMPALAEDARKFWTTVGLVNVAGHRTKSSCTGTLIAPDLVVTAAHCAGDDRHFVAGWDRGTFAAHRRSAEAVVHPNYLAAKGNDRFRYDVAVLRLADPISPAELDPVSLNAQPARRVGPFTVLGYHRKRPHILNGRSDCASAENTGPSILVLDCEVIPGNSGGPVLAADGDGWTIVAIVSGRVGGEAPQALAAPVDDWLIGQWQAALDRAGTSATR